MGKELDKPADKPMQKTCGVIMPISATSTHSATHWLNVQTLLHRAIEDAGLKPHNVWEGSATDRITNRILSNLFAHPIAVCDISDLNANVMLELGMRLSSKKPTVVVREEGAHIPFDIADFSLLSYPRDLSMLAMEDFMAKLSAELQEKSAAADQDNYQPFLAGIEVEFVEPASRTVSLQDLIVSRLDSISSRLGALEVRNTSDSPAASDQRDNATGNLHDADSGRIGLRTLTYRTVEPLRDEEISKLTALNGIFSVSQEGRRVAILARSTLSDRTRKEMYSMLEGAGAKRVF